MLSRVNDWRGRESDSLKGWFRAEVTQVIFKLGHAKAHPDKSGPCGLERYSCVHQSSLQLHGHHFHGKETRQVGQKGDREFSGWPISEQGPLCVLLTECPRESHTHCVWHPHSGNASLLKGLSA